ncbi:MAG: hypothetical protein UR12_C0028G0003 [candidate division TM6 bacterium GW2011_GWF2_30_66]|jgi:hypothetical protein|nr:MAG: hypothetical protein UR12_C0028G0003 [candidate division TM6 bacterium GW2011_GWF2_30_66]
MINKLGYTLIEAIIAFSITILLIMLIFQFSAQFYAGLLEKSKFNTIYLENYLAFDHIVRNISKASGKKEAWLKITDNQVIWRESDNIEGDFVSNSDKKIAKGYIMQDQSLYYVTGSYNIAGGFWSSQRRSLLSSVIKDIKFSQNLSEDNAFIISITCKIDFYLKNKKFEFVRIIGLKNGILV